MVEAKRNVRRAQSLEAEIQKRASEELKAVRGEYAKSQETSVKTFSQMPLLGAVVLKSAEAYDGRRDYRVAAVMAWSPKLQKRRPRFYWEPARISRDPTKERSGMDRFSRPVRYDRYQKVFGS